VNPDTRKRLTAIHRASFATHGYKPDTLFWSTRGIQKTRFRVLTEIGIACGDSLLDVGCGFADLAGFIHGAGTVIDYTGIDLSPEILAQGQQLNPDLNLLYGDLFDFDFADQSFDWVMLSGTLNWQLHDKGGYERRTLTQMFRLCRKGVAFNMLDARKIDPKLLGDLIAHEPLQMLRFCQSIAPDSSLRDDYLNNDFTIYMRR